MLNPTCPAPSQLQDFILGKLPEAAEESLVAHLEACPSCEAAVAALDDASDHVVQSLRGPKQPEEFAAEAELAAALARVKELPRKPAAAEARAAGERPENATGENLGELRDYRLLEKIGEGGMGAVYKAMHTKLDKIVALKVLPSRCIRDEQAIGRFHREMKAVGRLEHPNIVGASDAGEADGQHFLVMQYVNGIDLAALMEKVGRLPVAEACELIRQAATALQFVHEQGMVHRDIKPSNLMVTSDGQVKLLDLGLALLHDQPDARQQSTDSSSAAEVAGDLTAHGQLMGTLDYMAPEQCDDSHQVDIRADIYSLGATLYKLLSGAAPFGDTTFDTPIKKMIALSEENAPPLRTKRPDVPEPLAAIIRRMLAKKPSQRFAAPADVANALAPFAESSDLPGWLAAEVSGLLPAPPLETLMGVGGLEPMQTAAQRSKDEFDPYYKWLAIPPEEQPPNHYRLLGLKNFEEDEDVIAVSADRQMVHIRTFQSGKYSKQSQRLLNEISAAKICLLNRAKRAAYDERLKSELAAKQPPPPKASAPAKPSAKPAVAKRIPEPVQAVEPEPPSVSAFAFTGESPQQPLHRKAHRRRSPVWQALAVGSAAAVLIVVGVVWFLVTQDRHNGSVAPGTKDTSVADAGGSPSMGDNDAVGGNHDDARDTGSVSKLPATIDDSSRGDSAKPSAPASNVDNGPHPPHAERTAPSEPVSPPLSTPPDDPAPVAVESPPLATPPARFPVPDAAARNRVLTLVRERYKDELAGAQTPPQKIETARLLRAAASAEREPATRFALLFEVRRLAIESAAVDLAMDAARQVIAEYETATWPVLGGTFDEVCKNADSHDEHLALANEAARLIEEAIEDDEIAAAEKIHDLVKVSLSKISDAAVTRKVRVLADQVQEMKPHWEQARLAQGILEKEPDNADAHTALGRYLCLYRDQWQTGLQHLEQGSDAELKALAAKEQNLASTAEAKFDLAEQWWGYARRKRGREQEAAYSHAYDWYRQAAPGLAAGQQQAAEERIAAIDTILGRDTGAPSDTTPTQNPTGTWVNVLDQVTDAVIASAPGTWKKVNGALVLATPVAGDTTLLDVPTKITGNYDLRVCSIVKSGDPHFTLRLPIGDRSCQLIVDGWKNLGGRTYIHTVDGVPAGSNPNAVHGQLLRLNQLQTHEVAVRIPAPGRATVAYALDGREIFTWSGNISSLTTESAGLFGIGCWGAQSVYQKFEVRAAAGPGNPLTHTNPLQIGPAPTKGDADEVWSRKADELAAAAARTETNEERGKIARSALEAAEEALADDAFDAALAMLDTARDLATRAKVDEFVKQTRLRSREIVALKRRYEDAEDALEKLADTPDDADLNLLVGRYLCFARSRWDEGLPYLAKADDARLAAAVRGETPPPVTAEEMATLGDAWLAASRTAGGDRDAMNERACHWYRQSLNGLAGLERARVEKLLAQYDEGFRQATFGLVAHWKFDEGAGEVIHDSVGQHHSPLGAGQWVQGRLGGGLRFSQKDGPALADPGVDKKYTFAMWVIPSSPGTLGDFFSMSDRLLRVMIVGQDDDFPHGAIMIRTGMGGKQVAVLSTANAMSIGQGRWQHLAVTIDGPSGQARIYVDGTDVTVKPQAAGKLPGGQGSIWLGGKDGYAVGGRIDDLRIYNRVLSPSEVKNLYATSQ